MNKEQVAQQEEKRKREEDKQKQLQMDREKLLQMPEFQRVMADILSNGQMFASVMTGNSMTYYNAGRHDLARQIWTDMARANHDLAIDLLKPKFGENLYD